jgi:hypothetical protein
MYTIFFIFFLDNVSSSCFGCYLHPSSGAQLQSTAIGFVSVENRGFSTKWRGGLLVWICVNSFFKISCDIYVLLCVRVCVSLDPFWYCVVMMCGFLADSFVLYFCTQKLPAKKPQFMTTQYQNGSNNTHTHTST